MKFKESILLLFIVLGYSCLDLRTCPENIFGKYYCNNSPDAINSLMLHEDGTYLHVYQQDDVILTCNGEWKRTDKSGCVIELTDWKSFNEDGEEYKEFMRGLLFLNGDYLDISPDGESATSFKKEI